jgi:hypothetical protein
MSEKNYETTYWNKELAGILGIGDSTLRKWCIELEKNGYEFFKDKQGNRAFTDHDAIAMRKFKELVQTRQMTLENAANAVISTFSRINEDERTTPVLHQNDRSELVLSEFRDKLLADFRTIFQEEVRQELAAAVHLQEDRIQEDRQKRFTERMTERRIEFRLQEEALQLWAQQPHTDRYKKVGWFRKEEDVVRRESFVRHYVNQNFEDRSKEAYGLES